MIDFNATKEELITMGKICNRAEKMGIGYERLTMMMDLEVAHSKNPLRLDDFLNAKDFDFAHDIGGIRYNINREIGELLNCFLPRHTKK